MAQFDIDIQDILAMSGRKNTYRFTLLDKEDRVKFSHVDNIKSFTLTYSSLSTLKATLTVEMHDDKQYNFVSDRLQITMLIDVRGYHFEFPLGVYLMKSPEVEADGNTTSLLGDNRSVTMYSKLLIYDEDMITSDMTIPAGTHVINKVRELLNTDKVKLAAHSKVTAHHKIYKIGTSKLTIINDLLESIGFNSLSVDGEGYFYSQEYILPDNRSIEFEYTDEKNQQVSPIYRESLDLPSCYNVFTGSCVINNQCINYTYVNSSSYSPISTVNRGRSVCADPQEFQDCVSREDLMNKVMAWAADNSYKYHKCSFTTFINPLHGYLNCIHFKNSKVNMKGIETQWVIDSSSDSMEHTIREAVYL